MCRVKQAGKRAKTDPNPPQPPLRLSQTPVELWFEEEDELTDFDECPSKMEILPPKYIGDGVLSDAKYPEFWRLIDIQGLRPFLYTRGSREFKFTHATLAAAWGLRNGGDTFKGGNHPLVSRMSTDHRLLLYVLSYVLLPWKSNHGTATEEDLLILWQSTSFLALAHLWIGLFEIASLDLSCEEVVNPGSANIITSKNINQMRRNLIDQADVAEGVGEEAAEDMPMPDTQPQPTVGTSSQFPIGSEVPVQDQPELVELMRNGFKEMRVRLSDMFTGLSDRIDGLEAHMTSQDTDIRGLRDELRSLKGEDVTMDPPEQQEDAPAQD
ncbi:hypothetical protein PIB30_099919 [Stylosanthes scabra]|uniref:Uncharacterized protein n=1 Tax=Stylosanthes scabra TaxID=79078 RepID=A0ABU6W042_9FABA|nr:hypothetical protein [Stylosanthes scabra]